MEAFLAGLVLLALGYAVYGGMVSRAVAPDPARPTPALACADGVDYVAMPTWRIFLIQLLNIAGLGPVFGPILGALWGPQVLLWVVVGSILGGAVHDLLGGAMSTRQGGAGLPELIGRQLGPAARHGATLFILVLMVLVGTVFVKAPAGLLVKSLPAETVGAWFGGGAAAWLAGTAGGATRWLWIVMGLIFLYYLAATLLPIDKVIGRLYPLFALALLVMVAGLLSALLAGAIRPPAFHLRNLHPDGTPAWPVIFVTVSCGAISGFHATQSPLMARCLKNERHMRPVFYGAMIVEALIALVWAAAAAGYYGGAEGLAAALGPKRDAAAVVHEVCIGTMGRAGGILAILGVVVLPITSGDTAFRAARLIAGDYLRLPQRRVLNRYAVALPLFAASAALNFLPFNIIWRYFGWANQTLAAVTLWAAAVWLARRGPWWALAAAPAAFMTVMTTSYLAVERGANGGLGLSLAAGTALGLAAGAASSSLFLCRCVLAGRAAGRRE